MSPLAPRRPCTWPGCPTLTESGRCTPHRKQERQQLDAQRGTSTQRGYGVRWQAARKQFLADHPCCVLCERENRLTAATEVDHRIPHHGNHQLFWDASNWQPLCRACHSSKTAREDGRWN